MGNNVKKKGKFRLQKRARRTIACLLVVSAVIISFAPTKHETQAYVDPNLDVIGLDQVINDYYLFDESVTSVTATGGSSYNAFSYAGDKEIIAGHEYYMIDMEGMRTADGSPVPVLKMGEISGSTTLEKFEGYAGEFNGKVDLSKGVCFMDGGDTGTVSYNVVDGNVTKNYTQTYLSDTVSPGDLPRKCYKVTVETVDTSTSENKVISTEVFYACNKVVNVHNISDTAFLGNSQVSQIDISGSELKKIGNRAFKDCQALTSVKLGNKVASIGRECFANCTNLSTFLAPPVEDGSMLNTIGDGAFAGCNFTSIELPKTSDLQIGAGAFYGCQRLNDIYTILQRYEDGGGDVTIGSYAFANCTSLKEANLYKNLKSSNRKAGSPKEDNFEGLFAGCTSLEWVELPEEFGSGTYNESTVLSLGQYTFQKCNALNRVKFTGRNARPFNDWQFITESNKEYAEEKGMLRTVADSFVIEGPNPYPPDGTHVPTNNTETGSHKSAIEFSNIYRYTDYDKTIKNELVSNKYLFNFENGEIKNITPQPGAGEELIIPTEIGDEQIFSVGEKAFQSNSPDADKLKRLYIKDNIKEIGNEAFSGIPNLQYVKFKNTGKFGGATSIGKKVFNNCPDLYEVDFVEDDPNGGVPVYYDVASIGKDAFKTNRSSVFNDDKLLSISLNRLGGGDVSNKMEDMSLVMKGSVDPLYAPYRYALNMPGSAVDPDNTTPDGIDISLSEEFIDPDAAVIDKGNIVSDYIDNSYITYTSGNPDNISMRYFPDLRKKDGKTIGGVSLLTYPTLNTMVGRKSNNTAYTIDDIILKKENTDLSAMEGYIITDLIHITVPEGVDYIDKAMNTQDIINGYKYMQGISGNAVDDKFVQWLTLNVTKLPNAYDLTNETDVDKAKGAFYDDRYLNRIEFLQNVTDIGTVPFMFELDMDNYDWPDKNMPDCSLETVLFLGDAEDTKKEDATVDDKYYWCNNGIVYSYYTDKDGKEHTVLEEVLYGRGNDNLSISNPIIDSFSDPDIKDITDISPCAFKNCPYLVSVDLNDAQNLEEISSYTFDNCPNLSSVDLPESVEKINDYAFRNLSKNYSVIVRNGSAAIRDHAFDVDPSRTAKIFGIENSAVHHQVDQINSKVDKRVVFSSITGRLKVEFIDWDKAPLMVEVDGNPSTFQFVNENGSAKKPSKDPERPGYDFVDYELYWPLDGKSTVGSVKESCVFIAIYKENGSGSTTTTTTTTTTTSSSSSSSSTSRSTSSTGRRDPSSSSTDSTSSSSTQSSSARGSSGGSSSPSLINSSTVPIVISGYANPSRAYSSTTIYNGNGGNTTVNTASKGGRTNVISTTDGITDVGKMSANVNGSSDSYVVKISETPEADAAAIQALTAEFGSLTDIRYLPIDISLYDSTGTNKISPVPEGVTVSITIPIPDDLAIYGGNAKIASTIGGKLDKMAPRFTVINSVPCMTFTASHFSPYVIYVDTANLTAAGTLDSTPKTGDPIHPKWFLVTGLIAAALFMFLKKDNEENLAAA